MNSQNLCPLCEVGYLHDHHEKTEMAYSGQKSMLDSCYSVCNACGAEQVTAEQARFNKRTMNAFKKTVDGLLTGKQVRGVRERLGLTQAQAAQIFGGGPVAFSKYESDDVAQSEAMDKLLRLAADVPDAFSYLAQKAGIDTSDGNQAWQNIDVDWQSKRQANHPQLRLVHSKTWSGNDQRKYG